MMKNSIFKTGRFLMFAAGLLAVMSACKKENTTSELRAVMNDYANSRQKAYIDPEQYNCFVVNETVRVNNSTGVITALERSDRQCVIDEVPVNSGSNYNAFYPAKLLASQTVGLSSGLNGVEVNFPQTQECRRDANGNQIIDNPMVAQLSGFDADDNYTLHFNNVCALLKVTVRTQDAYDAIHVTMSGQKLWGSGKILGNKVVMDGSATSERETVILSIPGHTNSPAGEAFYIMIPEVTLSSCTVTVSIIKNGNNSPVKTFERTGVSGTLEYNKIHTLGNFTFNAKVFTVSSDNDKVIFSPGNLQWSYTNEGTTPTTHSINGINNGYNKGTWRFAPNQFDIIGAGNTKAYGNSNGEYTGKASGDANSYTGWIDHFLWGGSGYGTSRPFYCSVSDGYCNGSSLGSYDWGDFNTIYNPKTKTNDPYGTWRMLTSDEWDYMLYTRSGWRYSLVVINFGSNNIEGVLIYPDNNYHINEAGDPNGNNENNPFCVNADLVPNTRSPIPITEAEFDILDGLGCAFLPVAGKMVYNISQGLIINNENGFYWTSNSIKSDPYIYPNYLYITKWGGHPEVQRGQIYNANNQFMSVRLVRDVR
ncbi:MAG: hypothetical protein IKP89_06840 [Bacteroidales bacterium]|nr:hypothetical protein [Bacteroidales bacterium]